MKPLVSIIIPVYNRESLILETLRSVQQQSYKNWECIIVDDHSTDNSLNVVKRFCKEDSRFKLYVRPEGKLKGANACRNFGFYKSIGEFVNWFDSDDIMHEDFLTLKIKTIEATTLDGIISKTQIFEDDISNICGKENRTKLTKNTLEDFLQLKLMWYLQNVLWRRTFLQEKQLFNEELLAGQDRDFHARMLLQNPSLKVIDKYLMYYRRHKKNITTKVNNARNETLRRSHLTNLVKFIDLLKKENKLTNNLRVFYHSTAIKYLPSVFTSKKHLRMQIKLLKALSFFNFKVIINWLKFALAYVSFSLFGKGEKILK